MTLTFTHARTHHLDFVCVPQSENTPAQLTYHDFHCCLVVCTHDPHHLFPLSFLILHLLACAWGEEQKADNKHAAGEWRLLTVNEISAGQRWREETNLLYVAITRAQRALILNRQLSRFFRHRDERRLALPTSDEAGCEVQGHPENVGIVPEGDMQEVRLAEEAVWEHWDARMTALLARCDVNVEVDEQLRRAPFPRDPQGNELLLHPSMEADHVRRYLRALSLRWHPDKWAARLARASQGVAVWVQGELQRVMAIVGKTMREHSPDGRDGPNRI
jgi:ATP-dependent exoDNAse (exonuclease V) beta subunit